MKKQVPISVVAAVIIFLITVLNWVFVPNKSVAQAAEPTAKVVASPKTPGGPPQTFSIVFQWDVYPQVQSITGFTLYEHTGGTTYVAVANMQPGSLTTYTLSNVSSALHAYVLTAVNSNTGGESAPSNEVQVNVPAPPTAPTGLRASVASSP